MSKTRDAKKDNHKKVKKTSKEKKQAKHEKKNKEFFGRESLGEIDRALLSSYFVICSNGPGDDHGNEEQDILEAQRASISASATYARVVITL